MCVKNTWKFTFTKFWNSSDLIEIDEKVKMSKRKLISYKYAVEEESDENLEDEDDLEELLPENQVHFQLQPGKTKL